MESGTLGSTGKIHFRPEGVKFLKLKTANVDVAASLCMDCGHVTLVGDKEKVQALMDEK
jgi:hypothetical protein